MSKYFSKEQLIEIASNNLDIIKKGSYTSKTNKNNDIKQAIDLSIKNSILINDTNGIQLSQPNGDMPEIVIYNEGVIQSILEERKMYNDEEIIVLNFASARKPGGGYLTGSKAQEECIMRGTTLYPCVTKFEKEYYVKNRRENNPLYTDTFIYTPNVPVIRNENQELIDYVLCSFITSAAVNKGYAQEKGISSKEIDSKMQDRIDEIIKYAVFKNPKVLILGAFGCGVFKNNPRVVAKAFKKAIENYVPKEMKVVFAIKDDTERLINIFIDEIIPEMK